MGDGFSDSDAACLAPSRSASALPTASPEVVWVTGGATLDGVADVGSLDEEGATSMKDVSSAFAAVASSTRTVPLNGGGRSLVSHSSAGATFRNVKVCVQPLSLAMVALQIALPSGVACTIP